MENNAPNTYEIIENEKGELLVLLYEGEKEPKNPTFFLNKHDKYCKITRNQEEIVLIENLTDEHLEKISALSTLYVCELKFEENITDEKDSTIVYAYQATKRKKQSSAPKTAGEKKNPKDLVQEKLQQTRAKIINKQTNNNK